jgi:hypothetical protein
MAKAGCLGISVIAGNSGLVTTEAALSATTEDAPVINDTVRVRAARHTFIDKSPPTGATCATLSSGLGIDTEKSRARIAKIAVAILRARAQVFIVIYAADLRVATSRTGVVMHA